MEKLKERLTILSAKKILSKPHGRKISFSKMLANNTCHKQKIKI